MSATEGCTVCGVVTGKSRTTYRPDPLDRTFTMTIDTEPVLAVYRWPVHTEGADKGRAKPGAKRYCKVHWPGDAA